MKANVNLRRSYVYAVNSLVAIMKANVTLRRSYVYAVNPLRDCGCNSSREFTILLRLTSPSRLCKAITIAFAPFRLTCRQRDIQL